MEVLQNKDKQKLLDFIASIKNEVAQWQIVEVGISDNSTEDISTATIIDPLQSLFKDSEGKIFIHSSKYLIVLIKSLEKDSVNTTTKKIEEKLSDYHCEVHVQTLSSEGIKKVMITIAGSGNLLSKRKSRKENIIFVADDDMFTRTIAKGILKEKCTVIELADGKDVEEYYKKYNPDIVFLDIHMPNRSGFETLKAIYKYDPDAFIVMLSADSKKDNIIATNRDGASGFVTKPFTKEKLMVYVSKCHTIS